MGKLLAIYASVLGVFSSGALAFTAGNVATSIRLLHTKQMATRILYSHSNDKEPSQPQPQPQLRRLFLQQAILSAAFLSQARPANALVKGNAPPKKKKVDDGAKKCSNVVECQEMAEKREAEQEAQDRAKGNADPPKVTAAGTRYRDVVLGEGSSVVAPGSSVVICYKVLKLGKRSFDGLSGEGTVVFSRGYGLEDDEQQGSNAAAAASSTFDFVVGETSVIAALNDGIVGMLQGGIRRISVIPQRGWELPTQQCDGGPGGSGRGGELVTDYVVVPTATMVSTESCFDKSKRPFPTTYAEQRRMAQRFDQSLILQVEVKQIGK